MRPRLPVSVPHPSDCRVAVAAREPGLGDHLESLCLALGYQVVRGETLGDVRELMEAGDLDVAIVDALLLGEEPGRTVRELARPEEAPGLLVVAPPEEPSSAFAWLEHGAMDILHRPPHPAEVRMRVEQAIATRDMGVHLASLEDAITERSRRSFTTRSLVTHSPAMRKLADTLDRVARMRTTVLILGESGSGKELVARALHFRSPRLGGPFIAINCAALPPHLIESELFGHERGAFTGAVSRRAGKFELAHNGTLFLDEVGETDLPTQAKLLRVLEHQEFMRVGGSRPVRVDVRLVAATNADLERLVREGRFREDLYYRLKVVTLRVPPLRERVEDIPELAETFLASICRANHLRPRRLTSAAIEALCRYPWPGNVRELINTLEAIVVATPTETIDREHLPANIQAGTTGPHASPRLLVGRTLRDIEAEAIRATLLQVGGSRTEAARILGIGLRTIRRKIRELGLDGEIPPRPGRPSRRRDGAGNDRKRSP